MVWPLLFFQFFTEVLMRVTYLPVMDVNPMVIASINTIAINTVNPTAFFIALLSSLCALFAETVSPFLVSFAESFAKGEPSISRVRLKLNSKLADIINQVITKMENYKDDNGKRAGVIGPKKNTSSLYDYMKYVSDENRAKTRALFDTYYKVRFRGDSVNNEDVKKLIKKAS